MGMTLTEIAHQLKAANKKIQLICAFISTCKTRHSREFIQLVTPKNKSSELAEPTPQEKQTVKLLLNHLIENYGYWQPPLEVAA